MKKINNVKRHRGMQNANKQRMSDWEGKRDIFHGKMNVPQELWLPNQMGSEGLMYIKTMSHDEIVPLPLSNFLDTFNANRNLEKSPSERPKWLKENGKHYIYFNGLSGSGKGLLILLLHYYIILLSAKQTFIP